MNVKIQGGGNGTYANTGSCASVTNYLQHEDLERMKNEEEVQPFFNQFRDYVSAREVTFKIDSNKAKLSRTDAKFYVITVSPSEKELHSMGRNSRASGTCAAHQKGEMGQSQSGASSPAGAGGVKNPTGGENAGHRAAHPQEAAGGRFGTPAETQKEQRFRHGQLVIFLFSVTKVTPHAAFVKGRFTLRIRNIIL